MGVFVDGCPHDTATENSSMPSLADLRKDYTLHGLLENEVAPCPFIQFGRWFGDAVNAKVTEPNAMTLATSTAHGAPSARIVLLKSFDERGFTFFTSYEGRKAAELDENPRAALVFYWPDLERQVRVEGEVRKVSRLESEEYFLSRPLGSRIGAWASKQSSVMKGREELETRWQEIEKRHAGSSVPLPETWGGYRLWPNAIEFWQGRPSRMHDRILYERNGTFWGIKRLGP